MEKSSNKCMDDKILSLSFNQDYSLFSMGTEKGFKIINAYNLNQGYEKCLFGGISNCELSYKSNYLALIGGGKVPKFNNKKVVIYNDELDEIESEFKFTVKILNVKLKKNMLFIVTEKEIFVFNIQNSQNLDSFETSTNKKGLIAINGNPNKTILAYPIEFNKQSQKGFVSIKNYETNKCFPQLVQNDKITAMAMDYEGLLLATSNEKGTIICIHSCNDGTLLQECRRGMEKADIIFISFDINYKYMGVYSDRKTIHIWKLENFIEINRPDKKEKSDSVKQVRKNELRYSHKKSISTANLSENKDNIEIRIKNIKNYKSESSFAKIRINDPYCIFCFKNNDVVLIISINGIYYKAIIDNSGGDCFIYKKKYLREIKFEKD